MRALCAMTNTHSSLSIDKNENMKSHVKPFKIWNNQGSNEEFDMMLPTSERIRHHNAP